MLKPEYEEVQLWGLPRCARSTVPASSEISLVQSSGMA